MLERIWKVAREKSVISGLSAGWRLTDPIGFLERTRFAHFQTLIPNVAAICYGNQQRNIKLLRPIRCEAMVTKFCVCFFFFMMYIFCHCWYIFFISFFFIICCSYFRIGSLMCVSFSLMGMASNWLRAYFVYIHRLSIHLFIYTLYLPVIVPCVDVFYFRN